MTCAEQTPIENINYILSENRQSIVFIDEINLILESMSVDQLKKTLHAINLLIE